MLPEEITWSIAELEQQLPSSARTCLNVGAEGDDYNQVRQPWNMRFFEYLSTKKIEIKTIDSDPEAKPTYIRDITQDVTDIPKNDLVIATHILEHVTDIRKAIDNVESLVKSNGGILLVSVPHRIPKHERPIDNMWRPTPEELAHQFKGRLLNSALIDAAHQDKKYIGNPTILVSVAVLAY